MAFAERIGRKVARNIAKHFDEILIPSIWVCMDQLEKIKKGLEEVKKRDGRTETKKS